MNCFLFYFVHFSMYSKQLEHFSTFAPKDDTFDVKKIYKQTSLISHHTHFAHAMRPFFFFLVS